MLLQKGDVSVVMHKVIYHTCQYVLLLWAIADHSNHRASNTAALSGGAWIGSEILKKVCPITIIYADKL